MINIPSLIAGFVARFLDALKFKSQRWWAITGALVIAIENVLLARILPFADQIPSLVIETVVAIAAIFINSKSFTLATANVPAGESIGDFVNRQLAILIEKFKAGSLTSFAAIQALFLGFKFNIVADTTLTWPDTVINILLSVAMLFLTPRTKPIIANTAAKTAKINGK